MSDNPTDTIDLHFTSFLERRQSEQAAHLRAGVADYSFALDGLLRQQLAATGPLRTIAHLVTSRYIPYFKQHLNLIGVAVGPQQYPHIYDMGVDCARRLGIGVPQMFIVGDGTLNACTIATNDLSPVIFITSALADALTADELKFVIGHECGHVHNLHGMYNTLAEVMANPLIRLMLQQLTTLGAQLDTVQLAGLIMQTGLRLFMLRWSRCAEITSDRAGLICCGSLTAAEHALAKLVIGGAGTLQGINIDEYVKQLANVKSSTMRLRELYQTHPLIARRIEALRMFAQCSVLHSWRPELATEPALAKDVVDQRCEEILSLLKKTKPKTH